MHKILILISIFLLTACTHNQYETVEIVWKNQNNATLVRWMWVRWSDRSILTSAHVVRDDTLNYRVDGEKYIVVKRDISADRAILSQRVVSGWYTENIWQLHNIYVWDPIYTEVIRAKKMVRLTGKVLNPNGSVIGYDSMGRVTSLSWIILTDLTLIPWDSGAPIYNRDGEIVDVVHVR